MIPSSGLLQMLSADASQEDQTIQMIIRKILVLILMEMPVEQIQTRIAPMYLDAIAANGLGLRMIPLSGLLQMPCADVKTEARPTEAQQMEALMIHQVAPITNGARLA